MDSETSDALRAFTQRYCDAWQQQRGTDPRSEALYGVPSPCITRTEDDAVFWRPQPFPPGRDFSGVEKAIEIVLQPPLRTFYTFQLAGDMQADFGGRQLTLLQAWSEDDFLRVQENLIGHLVMQRRLKLSPTLFVATLESELDVISVCNLSGEVVLETVGTRRRTVLSASLASFLSHLEPVL